MALANHQSLFGDPQGDLFPSSSPRYQPKVEHVRNRLDRLLVEARGATALPWDAPCVSLYRSVFKQLALYLPEDEGAQYRLDFEAELVRLGAPAD